MTIDESAAAEARAGWAFVRESRNALVGNCNVASLAIGFNQAVIRDLGFNLILASALAVLHDVLRAARERGQFTCRSDALGALMQASARSVAWREFDAIDQARRDRNASIHDLRFLPHATCRDHIAAIEHQLADWQILSSTAPESWHW